MDCTFCGKQDIGIKERDWKVIKDREYEFLKTTCGHTLPIAGLSFQTYDDIESRDGEHLFKYQVTSAEFARAARFRCLFTHEMGVGKMIITIGILAKHLDEMAPVMIVCKSTIMVQWAKKIAAWIGQPAQVIDTGRDIPLWGIAKIMIVSYDLLRRVKWIDEAKTKVRTFIIDEVQNVKNSDAKRTQKLMELVEPAKYTIGLSGTPIKNHAREYGPILKMVLPHLFPTMAGYERDFVSPSGYLYNPQRFHEYTRGHILRYTRKEVLPDIPEITRQYDYHNMTTEVQDAYEATLNDFCDFMGTDGEGMKSFAGYGQGLGYLSKMRHLTGLAKVGPALEYADDFLSTGEDKLVLFVHHQDVALNLKLGLQQWKPLMLEAKLDKDRRDKICSDFWLPENRLLIASTLVGGEGINLQCCANLVMVERQWNPANEEQAEARFPRPGQKSDKITALYLVAVGTIDELLARLVEKKRALCTEVVDGKKNVRWDETDVVREIGRILAEQGKQAWSMR